MTQGSFSVGYAKEAAELSKLFIQNRKRTGIYSHQSEARPLPHLPKDVISDNSPISSQKTLPKREPPLTRLPGEFSLTARCT